MGRALVEHYAHRGVTVFGCSRGQTDFSHDRYKHLTVDITDKAAVRTLIEEVSNAAGRLDVLVNNAGIKHDGLALLSTSEQAESMMRGNFLGTFHVTREAVKVMRRQRFGRIINISSIVVPLGSSGSGLYAASKAAVEQFSFSLAREFADVDVTVNTIGISIFKDSDMLEALDPKALRAAQDLLIKPNSLNAAEVVHVIDFFASPQATNITNQTVYFGGVR
jgi:3-oxoacyl-[acyl-carrier protein] reductase